MDPLKRCALLALLGLLRVGVLAGDAGCGSERTGCRVTSAGGDHATLECAGRVAPDQTAGGQTKTNMTGDEAKNWTQQQQTADETYSCDTNDTSCERSYVTTVSQEYDHGNSSADATEIQTKKPIDQKIKPVFHKDDTVLNSDQHFRSSLIEVHLLGNNSFLDISSFVNLKTVIINTNGFHLLKLCGAKNISALTVSQVTASSNLSFVNFFSNLKYLNLSNNIIDTFPRIGLPLSISSIDLSFNSITLNSNYSLPPNLHVLNISYNNVSNTEEFILKGNVIVLDIRGSGLPRVPVMEMPRLEELYLSDNNITALKEKSFLGLMNLTILDLRGNRLRDLEEKVFQGLNRLQWLDLSKNNLMSLAPATFQYLNNLVTLLLSNNVNLGSLKEIEDASLLFGTGQRLQEIEASSTNLSKIPSTVTRSVRKLLLTDNTICTIQCGELDSFPLLQVIDVSNNVITEIEEDALGRLEFLSDLVLAGNKLMNIPKSLPNQLQTLDLRCNRLNKLTNIDFLGLQKLRVLLLSNNNISIVEDGAFGQLINLDVLDLSYNPIKTLYRSSFTGPRSLKELYLVSLKDLIPLKEPLSFPAPESSHLEVLILDSSPELAARLMDDVAALTMFHELYELSLRDCRLESLRGDLQRYLTRLHKLELSNNPLNCTDVTWLVKWLQTLNISQQETGRTGPILHTKICRNCKGIVKYEQSNSGIATCAFPQIHLGKSLTNLIEETFPDLTSTTLTPVTTVKILKEVTTTAITQTVPEKMTSKNILREEVTRHLTTPTVESVTTVPTLHVPVTEEYSRKTTEYTHNTSVSFNGDSSRKIARKPKVIKSENSINKLNNIWKYSKNLSKNSYSTVEPFIVLINDTKHTIREIDNQTNESISSGAFLAHEPAPSTSHPGMMVFLFVVAVISVASSVMVYSHWAQIRRSSQYQHHQDIEVSSFGGNELW